MTIFLEYLFCIFWKLMYMDAFFNIFAKLMFVSVLSYLARIITEHLSCSFWRQPSRSPNMFLFSLHIGVQFFASENQNVIIL